MKIKHPTNYENVSVKSKEKEEEKDGSKKTWIKLKNEALNEK